ncbi:MAG: pyruvate, phosphate dikinase, partial [Candidatus Geothermarchaeales archaeon]
VVAAVSMPGMMDSVLNLGLNDDVAGILVRLTDDERFVYDAYRRLITMFSDVVMHLDRNKFDGVFETAKEEEGVERDSEVSAESLKGVIRRQKELYRSLTDSDFPSEAGEQLITAIRAVFNSWNTRRARTYRDLQELPHDMGTACSVQTMVFGNLGGDSASGVLFTRNPANGDDEMYGELLFNAQGEDVVAGLRTPLGVEDLRREHSEIYRQLSEISDRLERHYRDMQDIEFTIERKKLFILQTRTGKRTPAAAVKMAVDMVGEELIDREEALMRVNPEQIEKLLHKQVDPEASKIILAKGLPASPGAAVGAVVFEPDRAEELARDGERVILVRPETTPEDIHGIAASQGILTSRGGMTSHAAIVARGIGKPAVVGCEAITIDLESRRFTVDGVTVSGGETITLDGLMGEVIRGEVSLIEPEVGRELATLLEWADEVRRLGVMANADTKADAEKALELGAEGIGLARTEHMFLGLDRVRVVREMILARSVEGRKLALEKLLPLQVADFKDLLRVMDGRPVQIRLLDPPLHEFLPNVEALLEEVHELERTSSDAAKLREKRELLKSVRRMREANPMLGFRVCRLGIVYPEIYETQARAVFLAASELKEQGLNPKPEIMIPGTIDRTELTYLKAVVDRVADEVREETGVDAAYRYGTMIEMPRAALTAGDLAKAVDFFSFGTNDLTQTTLGLSRDDSQGTFLPIYIEKGIISKDPFRTLDLDGVGRLIELAVDSGRLGNPALKVGICGEHGGDPDSIAFLHKAGLDTVSCSPFRVPVARLAAAQAHINEMRGTEELSRLKAIQEI